MRIGRLGPYDGCSPSEDPCSPPPRARLQAPEACRDAVRQGISDDLSAAGIQNGREEAEAGRHPDLGEVRDPYPVRPIGYGIAVEVREYRGVVPAVGCPRKAPAGLYAKARKPHDPCYPLVIDEESVTSEVVCHAPLAVAGRFILDVFDARRQLRVGQSLRFGDCAIVVSAAWQVHGFAPPPDGAGAGPLITDDFSLPFTVGVRGVFWARSSSIVS